MTDREFFIQTIDDESPRFERVLKAMPPDKLNYTPHEKSRTAERIIQGCLIESASFPEFLEKGEVDMTPGELPKQSLPEMTQTFLKNLETGKEIAQRMSEKDWQSEARMVTKNEEAWKTTKGNMAWSLILDLVHHRGQLSAYLRPMGGKVPPIYGPSGDTPA